MPDATIRGSGLPRDSARQLARHNANVALEQPLEPWRSHVMCVQRWTWATRNETSSGSSLDRVAVFARADVTLAVLADGAGGMAGAAEAADAVVAAVTQWDASAALASGGADVAAMLEHLDRSLAHSAHGGQCTAVVVALAGGHIAGASVGDSVAWIVDDTLVELTASQRRKPLVGSGRVVATPFIAALRGRRVLLGSDGLWKYADALRVRETAANEDIEGAAVGLIELVRLPGGALHDDVSIALLAPEYPTG